MADAWLSLTGTEVDSYCGADGAYTPVSAMDGGNRWVHATTEVHWVIFDLTETYNIKKVKGRSNTYPDPRGCKIYVSDSKVDWGAAVATIVDNRWEDTDVFVELDTTDKDGRYIKIEITGTEAATPGTLGFGHGTPPFVIFDAYGETAGGVAHTHTASDTISISDSIATASVMKHAKTDTMTIGDTIGTVSVMKQALADTMSISDALLVSQGFHVAFADTMNISDSLAAELIAVEIKRRMGIARKIGSPTAQNIGVGL